MSWDNDDGWSTPATNDTKTTQSTKPVTSGGWDDGGGWGDSGGWDNGGASSKPAPATKPATSGGWDDGGTSNKQSAGGDWGSGWGSNNPPASGGGGGGSRACFKCGQDGHMSRDCPQGGGGSGGSRACFKCGQDGHMSRDCPQGGGGGGGSRACFKCGEDGHMSRDCPQGGGGGSRACFKCGQEGHMSRDCPQGGGGSGGSRACFKCGQDGHISRDCPQGGGSGGFGSDANGWGDSTNGTTNPSGGFGAAPGEQTKPGPVTYIPEETGNDLFSEVYTINSGINFDKMESVDVTTSAPEIAPITNFENSGLHQTLLKNFEKSKFSRPTPVQMHAIPSLMAGKDLMGAAQTGSGKTVAFLAPIIDKLLKRNVAENEATPNEIMPYAVIVTPTRELADQIHVQARKFCTGTGLNAAAIYGGVSVNYQLQQATQRYCHILIATVGRMVDFAMKRRCLKFDRCEFFVLDEADRMLDQGFETEVRSLIDMAVQTADGKPQLALFSASMPEPVQKLAGQFLEENYVFLKVGIVGAANTDINQSFLEVKDADKLETVKDLLRDEGLLGPDVTNEHRALSQKVLIFVEKKKTADFVGIHLSRKGCRSTTMHGDREQSERETALREFRLGKCPVLVATSVAARGLDIVGVGLVINYDMPKTIDEYVHRIGRTGRCGNTGRAISFFDFNRDVDLARALTSVLKNAGQEIPEFLSAPGAYLTSSNNASAGPEDLRGGGVTTQTGADFDDQW